MLKPSEALRAARQKSGMSLKQVADALGVAPTFVHAMEFGRRPIPFRRIALLPEPIRKAVVDAVIEELAAIQ